MRLFEGPPSDLWEGV